MKKILALLMLVVSLSSTAQITENRLTNHKEAISIAESQNKNILIFALENSNVEAYKILETELFNSEAFKAIQANFIFLELDVNADTYNKRLAAHYSGVKSTPVLALIDQKGNPIGQSLSDFNKESIQKFISFLKANIN